MSTAAENRKAGAVDVIVIGAGHAGLATSYCLAERSIDHVVLERGEVANSWRRERWDSLRLLTPNWQSRLPGYQYSGSDPDGFMNMPEVIEFISGYAAVTGAPIQTHTEVSAVRQFGNGFEVMTNRGTWTCRSLVVASGACNVPVVPKVAADLPASVASVTPHDYRRPDDLSQGGVLVVGASATGLQLAEEIHRSGRPVTIATGEHVRMPRQYRGKDIQWWLDRSGILDEGYQDVDDINRARRLPSPQLIGSREHRTLDLNTMAGLGVRIVGRLMGLRGSKAMFSGSLRNVCALADLKLGRMLDAMDAWAANSDHATEFEPPERFAPTAVEDSPTLDINLASAGIETVFWATGFKPDYSWLNVPVLDRKRRIRHDGGVTSVPGLYVTGLPVLRKRKSSFIHGAEDDARFIVGHLAGHLHCSAPARIVPGWSADRACYS